MKKIYFLIIILAIYSFNISLAQSSEKKVNRLAKKCSKGHIKSCEKLKLIAKNDTNADVKIAAVKKITDRYILADIAKNENVMNVRWAAVKQLSIQNLLDIRKITDQSILAGMAKNDIDYKVGIAAIKKITDQNLLADIAKNSKVSVVRVAAVKKITDQNLLSDIVKYGDDHLSQCKALILLNEHEYYQQITEIANQNKKKLNLRNLNLTAIAALKIIPIDKILKNNYQVLTIRLNIEQYAESYFPSSNNRIVSKTPAGSWRMIDYDIKIKINELTKLFRFKGIRGADSVNEIELRKLHIGNININEICEYLLSPLSKNDLLKISNESDVVYLRETAAKMLQN